MYLSICFILVADATVEFLENVSILIVPCVIRLLVTILREMFFIFMMFVYVLFNVWM